MKEVQPRTGIDAVVTIPGSKSITHRALITASLAGGESTLEAFLSCDDTLFTVEALRTMGAGINVEGDTVHVKGTGGKVSTAPVRKEIYLGNSGTSYRLLLSVAALGHGEYLFCGTPRMHERPVGDLVKALNRLGVKASSLERDGYPPILIDANGITGGTVAIPGTLSSQYLSSLLLSGPYAERDVEIEVTGNLVSRPYVDLTLHVMESFGVSVNHDEYRCFRVPGGSRYQPCRFRIEGDVSAASYFWGAAAITGGTVTTENIRPYSTRQGDIGLLALLAEMGCHLEKKADRVTVRGDNLMGIDVDMGAMPDMVPTLAGVALFAEGTTIIRNVAHLRHKESDRLGDTVREWKKLGAEIEEREDGLVVHGGKKLRGAVIDPHKDHRLAMSMAMIGLMVPGISIREENCVDKSFPNFWKLWDTLAKHI